MIEIKFEAANGADLRKEMLALLGISGSPELVVTLNTDEFNTQIEKVKEGLSEIVTDEPKKEEVTKVTRTRKPKEETPVVNITPPADAIAAGPANEETTDTASEPDKGEAPNYEENTKTSVVTAEALTLKCVELGRAGKRDAVLAIQENQFGGATISKKDGKPQLTVEQYGDFMAALEAIK